MKVNLPLGIEAIMARMPRRFVEHALRTAERARRLRAAQAQRFEAQTGRAASPDEQAVPEWQDTVMMVGHPDASDCARSAHSA